MDRIQLFPQEIIENSQEANFSKHTVRSRIIYVTVLLFVLGFFSALPFLYLDVGVRSQGFIRPATEVAQITSPVSGYIQSVHISENRPINQGDVFVILKSPEIIEKLRYNEQRQNQISSHIADLELLQKTDSLTIISPAELTSPRYRQSWAEFRQQLINQSQKIHQLNRELDRKKTLFERNAISRVTFDETLYTRDFAINDYKLILEQQKNQWRMDKTTLISEWDQLRSEQTRLQQELNQYEIRSPVTGTVQNSNGIFQNGFVYANQVLGEISPDTSIIAEVYVSPRDIGLLREGMPVRLQLDAYNQNQWGVASGFVKEISRDMIMNNGEPLFRVRCTLDQDYLKLSNGFQGEIKKGMSLQARFIVANRSLFQLLYDKVDDWLNPAWSENNYTF